MCIRDRTWSSVYGDEVISEGLSIISATPFKKLPEKFDEIEDINSNFSNLFVIGEFDRFRNYHNFDEWVEMLVRYEINWFSPLSDALERKNIDQLIIETDINSIYISKYSRYYFWRDQKSFIS